MESIVKEPLKWTGGPRVYRGSVRYSTRGGWRIAAIEKTNEGWNVYPMLTSIGRGPILSGPHRTLKEARASAEDI